MHDESDCRLGLLKSTKTNSGSANKIILSVQQCNNNYVFAFSHSFRLILLSVLRRMPLQGASVDSTSLDDCWFCDCEISCSAINCGVVVGGVGEIERLISAWLLCSLDSDTEGRCCLEKEGKKWKLVSNVIKKILLIYCDVSKHNKNRLA